MDLGVSKYHEDKLLPVLVDRGQMWEGTVEIVHLDIAVPFR